MNLISLIFGKKPREARQADLRAAAIRADTHEIRRRLSNIEKSMDDLLTELDHHGRKDNTDGGMGSTH